MRKIPEMPRLGILVRLYATLVLLFVVSKPCFLLMHGWSGVGDCLSVVLHGLPLDLTTAAYFTALPWLALAVSLWVRIPRLRTAFRVYAALVAVLIAVIFVSNLCLYTFWGFPLDGTVFNYLDSPGGAAASVSTLYIIGVVAAMAAVGFGTWFVLTRRLPRELPHCPRRVVGTVGAVVIGALLFLAVRGGIGKSTANVGMVYFSDHQLLNHAAVNPAFSIASSAFKTRDFAAEFEIFPEEERARLFAALDFSTTSEDTEPLLKTPRPNVLVIILEGCGGTLVHAVDPLAAPAITPCLNRLAEEGVFFSNCYANSFRTDRGVVCTLSGYPAFPDVSVMKLPQKCATLPSIAATLRRAGYTTDFLYGGDINFTNTNGYLLSTGYERTAGDTAFPAADRHTHNWGVTDSITFERLYNDLTSRPAGRPWHTAFLTLASHEPWKVPYDRIRGDERANAFAYTDACLGRFIERFRQTPQWDNTLIVLLPDHGIGYPDGMTQDNPRLSHIPVIWTGGAVAAPRRVDRLCNQTDMAATILGQLALPHDDFRFSRDVMSRTYRRPSAVHVWTEGIILADTTGFSVVNTLTDPPRAVSESPRPSADRVKAAEAYLQTIFDDLGAR